MGRQQVHYRAHAGEAARLLADNVRIARVEAGLTQAQLAARARCSVGTVVSVEHASPSVSIGHVLNLLDVLGLPLFYESPSELTAVARARAQVAALIPARVRQKVSVDDDF